jgi:hypothetical protein
VTEDQKETIGLLVDRLDSLAHGLALPIPAATHVDAMKSLLPEIVGDFKSALKAVGFDCWDDHPA